MSAEQTPPTEPVEFDAFDDSPVTTVADDQSPPNSSASESLTRPPAEWAEIYFPWSPTGRQHPELWKHAASDQKHGWSLYAMRTGQPAQLTAAQYEAAIAAVDDREPHAEADYRDRSE